MNKTIKSIHGYSDISGLIPGVRGQRAFPTLEFKASDPFLMLDHIGPDKMGSNFFINGEGHDHPHRGFETLTFMFEGYMDHKDSLGNKVRFSSGGIQRMNAGSGIIHGGDMGADPKTGRFHEMQLWINNPASEKMSEPDIHNIPAQEMPETQDDAITLRVISGELNGIKGKFKTKATTQIAHVIASGKGSMEVGNFPLSHNVMVYILEGNALIDRNILKSFQLATMNMEGNTIEIETEHPVELLILSGLPLNEPVAFGGPFVMNTQEEIKQANMDFQNGKFGSILK